MNLLSATLTVLDFEVSVGHHLGERALASPATAGLCEMKQGQLCF